MNTFFYVDVLMSVGVLKQKKKEENKEKNRKFCVSGPVSHGR